MIAAHPTRFRLRLDHGGSVEVRVIARPAPTLDGGEVTRLEYLERSRTAIIHVSDRATGEAIERAMYRRIAELQASLRGEPQPGVQDAGRVGELRWLALRVAAAPADARRTRDLAAMVEALGMRGGIPGTRRHRARVMAQLDARTADVVASFVRGPDHGRLRDGLTDTGLSDLDLSAAVLRGGHLARLAAARSRWCGADLSSTAFEDVDLSGADLSDVDATGAALFRARLDGAHARAIVFDDARLVDCDLTGCDLRDASFSGAVFSGCSLRGARLDGVDAVRVARFNRCDFRGADLGGRELLGMELVDCLPGEIR